MTKTLYIVICDSWNFHHLDQMNFCHIMIAVCQLSGGELHMNNIRQEKLSAKELLIQFDSIYYNCRA